MLFTLENGQSIRGDYIRSAVIRSDLSPIPLTLEMELRVDDTNQTQLREGLLITNGADPYRIVKTERVSARTVQYDKLESEVRITALLDSCYPVSVPRQTAIIREKVTLGEVYRAAGAKISQVVSDFPIARFYCLIGDTPAFQISRVLQEAGGVMRWKRGLVFSRLSDLFKQKPVKTLPDIASDNTDSGFLLKHGVSGFFTTVDNGDIVSAFPSEPSSMRYAPFQNELSLKQLSRCLARKKVMRISYCESITAGDAILFVNDEGQQTLVVMTAAHVFEGGVDGNNGDQYTKLWLGKLVD